MSDLNSDATKINAEDGGVMSFTSFAMRAVALMSYVGVAAYVSANHRGPDETFLTSFMCLLGLPPLVWFTLFLFYYGIWLRCSLPVEHDKGRDSGAD